MRRYPPGKNDAISDVNGVTVGHVTYKEGSHQTGVTAIKAHPGNHFMEKLPAAVHVMNGFGKSVGLVQIEELGQIETPIILTNTLSVGTCLQGLIEYMVETNPIIGRETGTVNGIVCECNDGFLNDIQKQVIKKDDVKFALADADTIFERGAVGGGRGMSCYELKGGMGTASCELIVDDETFTLGVLVQSNFGRLKDLVIHHELIGETLSQNSNHKDMGSVIVIVATNLPVDSRQLKRIIKRTAVGIARTGSYVGNGSGEIALGFSTAHKIPHIVQKAIQEMKILHEDNLEEIFEAVAEVTEAAILDSMFSAERVVGRDGHTRESLAQYYMKK